MKTRSSWLALLLVVGLASAACRSGMDSTRFVNQNFNFAFVERVAVLPFENLTNDQVAGVRATRLTITELLASGAVDVVELGEVRAALQRLPNFQPGQSGSPSTEEVISLGNALNVQAVIVGSVAQSETIRSGSISIPVVALDLHMVEVETGATVWAATHTEKGNTVGARLLGTAGVPLSDTTRRCVRQLLETLIG